MGPPRSQSWLHLQPCFLPQVKRGSEGPLLAPHTISFSNQRK